MRRKTAILASVTAAGLLAAGGFVAASSATAAPSGCTPVSGGYPYLAEHGDEHDYVQVGGPSYNAWGLRGARVQNRTSGAPDVTGDGPATLTVGSGGSATSPAICVAPQDDRVRFFYRAPAGTRLDVNVSTRSTLGTTSFNTAVYASADGWELTPEILVPDWTDSSGTQQVTVTLINRSGADVQVDDVLLDPWRTRRW